MAILNRYITVTSTATPASQDSPNSSSAIQQPSLSSRMPTKIILPKKKPQKWSTGLAPGDYGGPPLSSSVGRTWGKDEDPLTSDDFIWNKDFMDRMKRLMEKPEEGSATASKEEPSGFLNLSRAMSLDSLEVDLSKELTAPSKPMSYDQVEETQGGAMFQRRKSAAPTRREQEKWERETKATTGGTNVLLQDLNRLPEDPKVLAARSMQQYIKLKQKLQYLTLGIGGVGVLSAYVSYSPEVAASYGAGVIGSFIYMRMLGNSVDALKIGGAKGLVKGAVAQPRLLIPLVLVMLYNRWNAILVPEYGFLHLELIPILVGFFTYKIATFIQAIEDTFAVVERKTEV